MEKKLLIFLCIAVVLMVGVGCKKNTSVDKETEMAKGGIDDGIYGPLNIKGTVIEVKENSQIVVKISEERGGYSIDDIVIVEYTNYVQVDYASMDLKQEKVEPKVGDEIGVQYWKDELTEKFDGNTDKITVDMVEKPINLE